MEINENQNEEQQKEEGVKKQHWSPRKRIWTELSAKGGDVQC